MLKHSGVIKFQFQTGAIKSSGLCGMVFGAVAGFNSKLVRLKVG